jgi:hypothetical protein
MAESLFVGDAVGGADRTALATAGRASVCGGRPWARVMRLIEVVGPTTARCGLHLPFHPIAAL